MYVAMHMHVLRHWARVVEVGHDLCRAASQHLTAGTTSAVVCAHAIVRSRAQARTSTQSTQPPGRAYPSGWQARSWQSISGTPGVPPSPTGSARVCACGAHVRIREERTKSGIANERTGWIAWRLSSGGALLAGHVGARRLQSVVYAARARSQIIAACSPPHIRVSTQHMGTPVLAVGVPE
jgi:hypothetical protein